MITTKKEVKDRVFSDIYEYPVADRKTDLSNSMKLAGNILVFTQWSFKDALVQTYTLPYVDIIRKIISPDRKIFVATAEQGHIALSKDEITQLNKKWAKRNMHLLPAPYKKFGLRKMFVAAGNIIKLCRMIRKEKIKTIHAFCTPAGSIAYLLSKLTGTELIIDSYEPHAEAMVENGTWVQNSIAHKILLSFEKKQTKRAKAMIGTTAGMKQYALDKYGVEVKNFFVKPACVDLIKFSPSEKDASLLKEFELENKIVCVYAGKLGGIYFKEEIFDFIKLCYDHWKDDFRFLMLTNADKEEILSEIQRVGLPEHIIISRFAFHHDVPRLLSLGDFALNPVKPVFTKKYCTSIKDGEYWAMGLPVLISPGISDDSEIIEKENTGVVVDFSDHNEMIKAINKVEKLIKEKVTVKKKIREIAIRYRSFEIAEKVYKKIYS
jgi:glycosyltransferase involved in cell wall biosynthesis